ncbi:MAG: glycosyltransferase [Candidatus Binataceae bacterium]
MAVRNGSRYLRKQLDSIAGQSRLPDELVVGDNCSTDDTVRILERFSSSVPFPVRMKVNEKNLGIGKNFEHTISRCSGDIICLADSDDVWYVDKLRRIEEVFSRVPQVGIVFSDADLVGADLEITGYKLWRSARRHSSLSFEVLPKGRVALSRLFRWRPAWVGHTMAFSSRLRPLITPMPDERYLWKGNHDTWIAMLGVCLADAACIFDPLVAHRRHQGQATDGHGKLPLVPRLQRARKQLAWSVPPEFGRLVCARLASLVDPQESRDCILQIEQWVRHMSIRVDLPPQRISRLPCITRELLSGRYHRFSNGVFSAVRDLYSEGGERNQDRNS